MRKLLIKLIASIMAMTVAATLVAMTSYAWLTISNAPEVDGIQINIGGSDSILVAADMVMENPDGTLSHYPAAFQQSLDFGDYDSYAYINSIVGLTPVSTADGLNWILPDYYDETDEAVQLGLAMNGQIKDVTEFVVDNTLTNANILDGMQTMGSYGSYIYMDFWVVSPVDGCYLRVSTGQDHEDAGSYVLERMEVVSDGEGSYVLVTPDSDAGSAVRIGFLVNKTDASDSDLSHYLNSSWYNDQYTSLLGQYLETGEDPGGFDTLLNRFTLYEPNGDLHRDPQLEGYYLTAPLGVTDGQIGAVDICDKLTVQLTNCWKQEQAQEQTLLEQEFATALFGKFLDQMTADEVAEYFYNERLQGLYIPYISRGRFITSTEKLYDAAVDGVVSADNLAALPNSGATEDTHITILEKNVPQRIRMFIWLEGQDVDCVQQKELSNLILHLELAGSNQG